MTTRPATSQIESADAYADPAIYDLLHTPGTAEELDGLERIARRFVTPRPRSIRWLEPCCGTGRFLRLLARRGGRIAGIELDDAVAEYANRRLKTGGLASRARAIVGDVRDLDSLDYPPSLAAPFGFAFCPHNSLRHLASVRDLARHFRAVARMLSPRGVYAVGIGLQDPDQAIFGEDVHEARRGRMRVSAVFEYFETTAGPSVHGSPRMERVVSHTSVRIGRRTRTIESVYDLLCIDAEMWRRCVRDAGMVELAVVDDERAADLPDVRIDYAYRVLARPEHPGAAARSAQQRAARRTPVTRGAGRTRA